MIVEVVLLYCFLYLSGCYLIKVDLLVEYFKLFLSIPNVLLSQCLDPQLFLERNHSLSSSPESARPRLESSKVPSIVSFLPFIESLARDAKVPANQGCILGLVVIIKPTKPYCCLSRKLRDPG